MRIPRLNLWLFIATCLTTLMAGAMHGGADLIAEPWRIWEGIPYSAALMGILLVHEFGHYFASKFHRVEATLPYFIPVPPYPFFIGTMGAVIKMKSPIMTRRALVDIGASGPIAGFILSVIVTVAGLYMSEFVPITEVVAEGEEFAMGSSMLFSFLVQVVLGPFPETAVLDLHPLAFAGWIGFFVTMLNLLPVGQLDGGHIVYALIGEKAQWVSAGLIAVLAIFGLAWPGWLIWAVLLVALGLKHPPVYHWEPELDKHRKWVAVASLVIFVLTFIPIPFFPMELLQP